MSRADESKAEFLSAEHFVCAKCAKLTSISDVELNGRCAAVCSKCYLEDVPDEDVQGAIHDAEVRLEKQG
jgi:hypothetical protein